jgi:hypothetical protein
MALMDMADIDPLMNALPSLLRTNGSLQSVKNDRYSALKKDLRLMPYP